MTKEALAKFPVSRRLTKTDEFSSVFCFRFARKTRHLKLNAKPNGLPKARLGVVVPKRIFSKAVHRNSTKRLIREFFRKNGAGLSGADVVVQLIAPYKREDRPLIMAELEELFSGALPCRAS